jgi:hypothetical protein
VRSLAQMLLFHFFEFDITLTSKGVGA